VEASTDRWREASKISERFYSDRAKYYDLLIRKTSEDKQTQTHADFLEYAFRRHSALPVHRILDVACGGGRHVVELARRGYDCTGYDISHNRIQAAKGLAARNGVSVRLKRGNASALPRGMYDAVLALFILFLLPGDAEILQTLSSAKRSLPPGGLLICNIFNPFSKGRHWILRMVEDGPNVRETEANGVKMTEISKVSQFDDVHGVVWADETTLVEAPDGKHVLRGQERIRLLTHGEVTAYLKASGFKKVWTYADWKAGGPKSNSAEQIVFAAQA
jgi:2-polyprenyl-3-methyl-5-hydroxy-6-metoxy-1,4-benzoquinol methylase